MNPISSTILKIIWVVPEDTGYRSGRQRQPPKTNLLLRKLCHQQRTCPTWSQRMALWCRLIVLFLQYQRNITCSGHFNNAKPILFKCAKFDKATKIPLPTNHDFSTNSNKLLYKNPLAINKLKFLIYSLIIKNLM